MIVSLRCLFVKLMSRDRAPASSWYWFRKVLTVVRRCGTKWDYQSAIEGEERETSGTRADREVLERRAQRPPY